MKTKYFLLFCFSSFFQLCYAQQPQFVVVRPNGVSSAFTSWDLAYTAAIDGDNIYLPGVTISQQIQINKRLNVFGSGIHPDSSSSSGRTNIYQIMIGQGASGGSLHGVNITETSNSLNLGYDGFKLSNFQIRNCKFYLVNLGGWAIANDSLPTNILFKENLISSVNGFLNTNISFEKNLVQYLVKNITNSQFKNNIFLGTYEIMNQYPLQGITNSSFYNNIFADQTSFTSAESNSFFNNLKVNNSFFGCSNCIQTGNIFSNSLNDIFVSYSSNSNFPFIDNYHLKPTSAGKNAGTDGKDVGIYGTATPTPAGWVPGNPHIYYKTIAAETGTDGKLNVRVKVRTNN